MSAAKKAATKEPEDLLGTVEFMVITAVTRLDEAYGMSVFEAIQGVYPRISFGSVYTTLERLAWKGYLTSEVGDPEPVRGGRARKYYRITGIGEKVLGSTNAIINGVKEIENPAPAILAPAFSGKRGQ